MTVLSSNLVTSNTTFINKFHFLSVWNSTIFKNHIMDFKMKHLYYRTEVLFMFLFLSLLKNSSGYWILSPEKWTLETEMMKFGMFWQPCKVYHHNSHLASETLYPWTFTLMMLVVWEWANNNFWCTKWTLSMSWYMFLLPTVAF